MLATTRTPGGEPARSFVTFSWCLAEFDRDPVRHGGGREHCSCGSSSTWSSALPKFPEVPLGHTYDVLDDMERRFRAGGHSMQAVYAHRHRVAGHIGDSAPPRSGTRAGGRAARRQLSDCVGCDPT